MSAPISTSPSSTIGSAAESGPFDSSINSLQGNVSVTAGDVLICGSCSSNFSDIKLFIEHKQKCGNNLTCLTTPEVAGTSNNIRHSIFSTQETAMPSNMPNSLMSLPVGMPHVILQTTGAPPQMYRVVLEPSVNSSSQMNVTQVINTALNQSPLILDQLSLESSTPEKTTSVATSESSATSVICISNENNEGSSNKAILETGMEAITVDDSHLKDHLPSQASPLTKKEEEGVTHFLASQLALQAASQATNNPESIKNDNLEIAKCETSSLTEFVEVQSGNDKSTQEQLEFHTVEFPIGGEIIHLPIKKKKLACEYENCSFSTPHKKDMLRHVRKHTGEKPFQCTVCLYKFSRADKLKIHMRIHTNDRPYACKEPNCTYRGREKACLTKHIRTHTNERPFKCQLCPYRAKECSQLTVHLRTHTGDAPFHCQKEGCSAAFKTSSDLRRHEKIHTGLKPYKCFYCDYATGIKPNLKVHLRINHGKEEKFTCQICAFTSTSKKEVGVHERSHSIIGKKMQGIIHDMDPTADKETETDAANSLSKKNFTQNTSQSKNTQNSKSRRRRPKELCPKNYRCEECWSGFVRLDSYRAHMRQHVKMYPPQDRNTLQFNLMQGNEGEIRTSASNSFSSYVLPTVVSVKEGFIPGVTADPVTVTLQGPFKAAGT